MSIWVYLFKGVAGQFHYFGCNDDDIEGYREDVKDFIEAEAENPNYANMRRRSEIYLTLAEYIRKNTRETEGIYIDTWS